MHVYTIPHSITASIPLGNGVIIAKTTSSEGVSYEFQRSVRKQDGKWVNEKSGDKIADWYAVNFDGPMPDEQTAFAKLYELAFYGRR